MTTHDFYQLLADTRVQAHIDAHTSALDYADRPSRLELAQDYRFAHTEDYDGYYFSEAQLDDLADTWASVYYATALQIWARYDAQSAAEFAREVW